MRRYEQPIKAMSSYFNPRTPYGVRRKVLVINNARYVEFQSTHSIRSATSNTLIGTFSHGNFNPRTPYGVRLGGDTDSFFTSLFQSTHSIRSATNPMEVFMRFYEYFNPRTPYGVRPALSAGAATLNMNFNPRTPYGVRLLPFKMPGIADRYFNPRTPYGVRLRRLIRTGFR